MDVKIVKTTVEKSSTLPIVLVGDENDLFILLLFHVNSDSNKIYCSPEAKHGDNNCRVRHTQD